MSRSAFVAVCAALLALLAVGPVAVEAKKPEVTIGSVVKLLHDRTKYRLHSHEVAYGSGSGQQSVTAVPNGEDANSYWVVSAPEDQWKAHGTPVKSGDKIRLQHSTTKVLRLSHSTAHPICSPMEWATPGRSSRAC